MATPQASPSYLQEKHSILQVHTERHISASYPSPSVEEVSQQNRVLVNGTTALSHLLNNSRRTIIQMEVLLTVAAVLLCLQLILGTWKRRWNNSFVSVALSVCNASLLPLVFYTLSIMQSSPVRFSIYPVWGAFLLMAAGGTNAVRQLDLDERTNKAIMQSFTVFARYLFYLYVLLGTVLDSLNPNTSIQELQPTNPFPRSLFNICLLIVLYFTKGLELDGFVNRATPVVMRILQEKTFIRMKKRGNDRENDTVGKAISCLPRPKAEAIAIDQVWGSCGNLNCRETLENVCLSLALCQSLIQRFWGLSSARASFSTTHDSVLNGLLQNEEHYKRVFKIIEVELGFCYDYFFTRYHRIYYGMLLGFPLFILRVIFLTLVLVYTVHGSVTIIWTTDSPIQSPIQVYTTQVDYIITPVLLGTALLFELLQTLVYLASNWIMVSLACQYVKHKPNAFLEKLIGLFSRATIFSPQRNSIAQYTIILPDKFFFKFFSKCNLDPVEISPDIEKAIARSIKTTFGAQTNRLASQVRSSMFEHWALKDHWTLKDHSQVEIMLIWHIATDYCHLSLSSGNGSNPDRGVAVTLSRYCAYLLAFVPQLLPYHAPDIKELISRVKKEIAKDLPCSGPSESYQKMKELGDDPPTVFRKGVELGKQLEEKLDEAQRWKAMADFWAKTMVYIAPSHITAKEHMRQLENGGEFLTYIWALLSHVGILRQGRQRSSSTCSSSTYPRNRVIQVISRAISLRRSPPTSLQVSMDLVCLFAFRLADSCNNNMNIV